MYRDLLKQNSGQGYGSKMLKRILKDIKQVGHKKVKLWVFEDNLKARKFYEANGFKNTHEIKENIQPIEIKYELNME